LQTLTFFSLIGRLTGPTSLPLGQVDSCRWLIGQLTVNRPPLTCSCRLLVMAIMCYLPLSSMGNASCNAICHKLDLSGMLHLSMYDDAVCVNAAV